VIANLVIPLPTPDSGLRASSSRDDERDKPLPVNIVDGGVRLPGQ